MHVATWAWHNSADLLRPADCSTGTFVMGPFPSATLPPGCCSAARKGGGGPASVLAMPNRILREGVLTSERVNALSLQAEIFYRRLMSVVDDYGRYFAHPALLRASCYPLRLNQTKEYHISSWLQELSESGLIFVYEKGETKYLEIQEFRQRQRYDSKYPDPKTVSKTVSKTVPRTTDPNCDTPTPTPTPTPFKEGGVGETRFEQFWAAYPRKVGKQEARKAWDDLRPSAALVETILKAVEAQRRWPQWVKDGGQFIPYPATWLNGDRWTDQLVETLLSEAERKKQEILHGSNA